MTQRAAPPARLMVVDDDMRYSEWLRHHLDVLCPQASVSMLTLAEFERWCVRASGNDCDVLMLSAGFGSSPEDPEAQGLALLRRLRAQPATPAIIALAEDGNELTAVRALQLGAVDYLPKRLITPERLATAVSVALRRVERRVARRLASLANLTRDRAAAPVAPSAPANPGAAEVPAGRDVAAQPQSAPVPESQALLAPGVAALLDGATSENLIPGYILRLKIGESEKAVVYLASSTRRGRDVALKVSKSPYEDSAGRQFLEREYSAILAIHSPLVVEIYDYGVHEGLEYLAMEYLPHGDLKARIQRGVSEADALRYVGEIAQALQVVHEAGLVHRDLKPPNVMLRAGDTVALIDFGLARSLAGGTTNTHSGVLLGSPVLHESGTGARRATRRALGFLQPRGNLLRNADRAEALHGRDRDGSAATACQRPGTVAAAAAAALRGVPRAHARQVARRTLRQRGGSHRRGRGAAHGRRARGAVESARLNAYP